MVFMVLLVFMYIKISDNELTITSNRFDYDMECIMIYTLL